MTDIIQTVLVLFALLQIKHTLADYFLQTQRMLSDRAVYAHIGRMQHASIHGGFSMIAALIAGLSFPAAIAFLIIDAVVHFHIDWIKGNYSERAGEGPDSKGYWRAFGVDQLAHNLTYLGLIWFWLAVFVG